MPASNDNSIDEQFDKLIIDLQTKITFQEDTVQALNEIVADQQQDILALKSQVKDLVEELKGILSSLDNASINAQQERPPHY